MSRAEVLKEYEVTLRVQVTAFSLLEATEKVTEEALDIDEDDVVSVKEIGIAEDEN